jgi:uncharacterized protein (DUF1015 family)
MPHIKAFQAFHPPSSLAPKVVCSIEDMSIDQAKDLRSHNPLSFLHLLIPDVGRTKDAEEKRELVFSKIAENFQRFVTDGILQKDEIASLYVYQLKAESAMYTGLWALSSVHDYIKGTIKQHEKTNIDRENQLAEYRERTGIDSNPVLITYRRSPEIEDLLTVAMCREPMLTFERDSEYHSVWQVSNKPAIDQFVQAFNKLDGAYIADGHHRASAAANGQQGGCSDFFTSVYISDEQLKLSSINRLIKDLNGLSSREFLNRLEDFFEVKEMTGFPLLLDMQIGLCLDGSWFILEPLTMPQESPELVNTLPITTLERIILNLLLSYEGSGDGRIIYLPGTASPFSIEELVKSGAYQAACTVNPITTEQFMQIVDRGEKMPPKSTFFEPKFPVGLLTYKLAEGC